MKWKKAKAEERRYYTFTDKERNGFCAVVFGAGSPNENLNSPGRK